MKHVSLYLEYSLLDSSAAAMKPLSKQASAMISSGEADVATTGWELGPRSRTEARLSHKSGRLGRDEAGVKLVSLDSSSL